MKKKNLTYKTSCLMDEELYKFSIWLRASLGKNVSHFIRKQLKISQEFMDFRQETEEGKLEWINKEINQKVLPGSKK